MPIIKRIHSELPFVQVSNATAQDTRLSYSAVGLLTYLLSLPKDWIVRSEQLSNRCPSGRYVVASALKELKRAGYAWTTLERTTDNKKLAGYYWTVADVPKNGHPLCHHGKQQDWKAVGLENSSYKVKSDTKETSKKEHTLRPALTRNGEWSERRLVDFLVGKFSDFTVQHQLHVAKHGSTKTGWTAKTLRKWKHQLNSLLEQGVTPDELKQVMRWYLKHHSDQFTPQCETIPGFVRKYVNVVEAMKRENQSINSEGSAPETERGKPSKGSIHDNPEFVNDPIFR